MIGNVLEWYDFAIYGYFAPQIGRNFFPHEDAVAQLLSAFSVFAIGYLMRPIGGGARRPYRRHLWTACGTHLLRRRHGDPDLSDRLVAGLSDDRSARAYRADFSELCRGFR
jgi:MFS family permease